MKKYNNYCTTCFVELFPSDPRAKTAHLASKELKVLRYLIKEFPDTFIHNKKLFIADRDNTCTPHNRRIDFQAEIDSYVLCIEVDENQHKYYDPLDEEKRIMQIYENADKNLIFIRFNPDNYIENGITKKTPLDKRLPLLRDMINKVIDIIKHGEGYNNWYTEIKMFFGCAITKHRKNDEQKIVCSGITRKKNPCKREMKNGNKFCRDHLTQDIYSYHLLKLFRSYIPISTNIH